MKTTHMVKRFDLDIQWKLKNEKDIAQDWEK